MNKLKLSLLMLIASLMIGCIGNDPSAEDGKNTVDDSFTSYESEFLDATLSYPENWSLLEDDMDGILLTSLEGIENEEQLSTMGREFENGTQIFIASQSTTPEEIAQMRQFMGVDPDSDIDVNNLFFTGLAGSMNGSLTAEDAEATTYFEVEGLRGEETISILISESETVVSDATFAVAYDETDQIIHLFMAMDATQENGEEVDAIFDSIKLK